MAWTPVKRTRGRTSSPTITIRARSIVFSAGFICQLPSKPTAVMIRTDEALGRFGFRFLFGKEEDRDAYRLARYGGAARILNSTRLVPFYPWLAPIVGKKRKPVRDRQHDLWFVEVKEIG